MKNYAGILIVALALLLSPPAAKSVEVISYPTTIDVGRSAPAGSVVIRGSNTVITRLSTNKANPQTPLSQGSVVNQSGKPLPKATVYAVTYGREQTYSKIAVDKSGKFRYALSGRTMLVAVAPGCSYGMPMDQRDRSRPIVIKLWPEYIAKGKIVDENGKPVAGAKVAIRGLYGFSQNSQDRFQFPRYERWSETTTGKDGAYLLPHLPDPQKFDSWNIDLAISSKGRATINRGFNNRDLQPMAKIFEPLESVVEGTLYLPGKREPAPAGTRVVVVIQSPDGGAEPRYTQTDAAGKFHLGELPPGNAGIMLMPPQPRWDNGKYVSEPAPYVAQALEVTLAPRRPATVEMVLTPGAVIKGVVKKKADGQPAKQARLIIQHAGSSDNSYDPEMTMTDENGEFAARVFPGDVQVSVQQFENSYYEQEDAPSASFKVAEGEEKTGVELLVTPSSYEAVRKPVPADFEVKPGDYDLKWDSEITCRSFAGYGFGDRKPNEVIALLKGKPKNASKNIAYRAYTFDGKDSNGLLMVALDKSASAKQFDTIYIDQNRNFDLSDDAPIKVGSNDRMRRATWVEVQSHQGLITGEHTDNPVQVAVQVYDAGARGAYCQIQKKGGWAGRVDTSAGPVDCAIGDSNCNGEFDDVTLPAKNRGVQGMGDFLFVDDNGLGRLFTQGYGPHMVQVYPISQIGRKFYSIKVNPCGNRVSIQPYTGPTGNVLVSADNIQGMSGKTASLTIGNDAANYSFSECDGKAVTVPAGTYHISQCTLALNSKKLNKPFNLLCEIANPVEVKADGQAAVSVSGPISLAIDPELKNMIWSANTTVPLSWNVKIGKDATVSGIGDNSTPPKVKFIDTKGKVIETVNAGYT